MCKHLFNPKIILTGMAAISAIALLAAFASEAFLGLEPCRLCIVQRWPYALTFILGALGLCLPRAHTPIIALGGLTFLVNSGIALYHSGIERHWWASALDGCVVPDLGNAAQSILENIMSAPTGRCDEIPWADPLLGLSMANYNVILCLALFVVCLLNVIRPAGKDRP